MKLAIISDTHQREKAFDIPDADVLVHCGDFTMLGELEYVKRFGDWFFSLPHSKKILCAGNHDKSFETMLPAALEAFGFSGPNDVPGSTFTAEKDGVIYLEDDEVTIDGIRFFGTPWTPTFGSGWVFNADSEKQSAVSAAIPSGIDVLISHGPPYGILDRTLEGDLTGSRALAYDVRSRVVPRVHCFGHIHEAYGHIEQNGIHYYNASLVDRMCRPANKPWVVEL